MSRRFGFGSFVPETVVGKHKAGLKPSGLQPVQPLLLRIAAIPDTAEVSTDDEVILFGQVTLLMECCRQEPAEITVRITLSRCKNYSDFYILMVSYLAFILKTSE